MTAQHVPGSITRVDDVLDAEQCADIIAVYRRRAEWRAGTVGNSVLELTADLVQRDPFLLAWIDPIIDALVDVNRQQWQLDRLDLPYLQVLHYRPGDAHVSHCDGNLDFARQWVGIVLALTAPAEYSGGAFRSEGLDPVRHPRGSVTFIPGHIPHHVEPVTAGDRYVVSAFACTPPTS